MRDDLAASPSRPRGVHWNPEVNLGHVGIIITVLLTAAGIYADIKSTVAVHENRIGALEQGVKDEASRRTAFEDKVSTKLDTIIVQLSGKQDRPR